jgi:hypothetical protein
MKRIRKVKLNHKINYINSCSNLKKKLLIAFFKNIQFHNSFLDYTTTTFTMKMKFYKTSILCVKTRKYYISKSDFFERKSCKLSINNLSRDFILMSLVV